MYLRLLCISQNIQGKLLKLKSPPLIVRIVTHGFANTFYKGQKQQKMALAFSQRRQTNTVTSIAKPEVPHALERRKSVSPFLDNTYRPLENKNS